MMRILWIWIRIRNIASKSSSLLTGGESNCHGFYNFCVLLFMYFSLFSSSISCCPIQLWGCQKIKREGRVATIRMKNIELHELPYTEIVESGTIRLASGQLFVYPHWESDLQKKIGIKQRNSKFKTPINQLKWLFSPKNGKDFGGMVKFVYSKLYPSQHLIKKFEIISSCSRRLRHPQTEIMVRFKFFNEGIFRAMKNE